MKQRRSTEKVGRFCFTIEQDRSRGDPVKTEYDQDQGSALAGQMRKPLSFAPPLISGWQRNTQRLFFVGPSSERFRKKPEGLKRATGQTSRFRTAGARGQW